MVRVLRYTWLITANYCFGENSVRLERKQGLIYARNYAYFKALFMVSTPISTLKVSLGHFIYVQFYKFFTRLL